GGRRHPGHLPSAQNLSLSCLTSVQPETAAEPDAACAARSGGSSDSGSAWRGLRQATARKATATAAWAAITIPVLSPFHLPARSSAPGMVQVLNASSTVSHPAAAVSELTLRARTVKKVANSSAQGSQIVPNLASW